MRPDLLAPLPQMASCSAQLPTCVKLLNDVCVCHLPSVGDDNVANNVAKAVGAGP
jgi:hypothetical protein